MGANVTGGTVSHKVFLLIVILRAKHQGFYNEIAHPKYIKGLRNLAEFPETVRNKRTNKVYTVDQSGKIDGIDELCVHQASDICAFTTS